MNIIIYRTKHNNAMEESNKLREFLYANGATNVMRLQNGMLIRVGNHDIIFRSGDYYWCLSGLRPDIYNTDDTRASEFLEQSACKCGGQERSMEYIIDMLIREYGKEVRPE